VPKPPAGPAPEFAALLATDRSELAAELFVRTFTPSLGQSYPRAVDLGWKLAEIGSVPHGKWTFDTDRPTDGALARLVTELALLWERAGLAARGIYNEGRGVVLLFRGEELLQDGDARSAVAAAIRAADPRH
jgi:hypothetical protein